MLNTDNFLFCNDFRVRFFCESRRLYLRIHVSNKIRHSNYVVDELLSFVLCLPIYKFRKLVLSSSRTSADKWRMVVSEFSCH